MHLKDQAGQWYYLAGIRVPARTVRGAVDQLKKWVLGKRVLIKFEEALPDQNSARPAYTYLSNRTFINARLIRVGLAAVDVSRSYRHRKRFENYMAKFEQ